MILRDDRQRHRCPTQVEQHQVDYVERYIRELRRAPSATEPRSPGRGGAAGRTEGALAHKPVPCALCEALRASSRRIKSTTSYDTPWIETNATTARPWAARAGRGSMMPGAHVGTMGGPVRTGTACDQKAAVCFHGGGENDGGTAPGDRRSDDPLGRDWCLWVQSANSQTYGSGLVAVSPVRTVSELWDAWDRGIAPAAHHVLSPGERLIAMGGEIVALSLFDARCRPEWENPWCRGSTSSTRADDAARVNDQPSPRARGRSPVCVARIYALRRRRRVSRGARCAGIRITRGRGQAAARCEVWLLDPSGDICDDAKTVSAADVARTLARTLAIRGLQVVTSVREEEPST